jgi:hypothetical protein
MRTAKRLVPLAVVLGIGAVLTVDIASGQAAGNGGTFHVWETDNFVTGATSIIFTGAVNDHGVDHIGVAGKHHQINKIVLQNGSFEVNGNKLTSKSTWYPGRARWLARARGRCRL